jgi:3'(2'), 5'-bisphosphate nucleotidase
MITKLEKILRDLGNQLLEWRDSDLVEGEWHGAQLKTEADMRAHHYLKENLNREFPGIPVVSEEDTTEHSNTRYDTYWLIDPIDGTASYANNFNGFVTQVALIVNNKPQVGVVYAPAFDLLYAAKVGSGATLNGDKLVIKEINKNRCMLVDNYPTPKNTAAKLYEKMGCTGYLESGSISLKICRIADGSADIFFKDVVVRDWDIAAPYVILKEAGGTLCMITGEKYDFFGDYEKIGIIAATSLSLVEKMSSLLKKI